MRRALGFCVRVLVGIASITLANVSRAADDNQHTCYKLVSVSTPLDQMKDPASKDWADQHTVTTEADGTQVVVKKSYPSHTWRINVKQASAVATDSNPNPPAKIEVTWTIPPDYWCSDQDVTISMTSKGTGNMWGGPHLYQTPAERWDQSPNTQIQGDNPFGGVQAGQYSAGFVNAASGSISLRPKLKGGDKLITLGVRLAANDDAYVAYNYERYDGPIPPPKPPQPPTPPQGCPKTFAKDWGSTWGQMPIQLDGNKASGTYSNRSGQYGPGTFSGTVNGNTLTADWKDARGNGTFVLTLSDDGCSFTSSNTVKGGDGTPIGPVGTHHPPTTGTGNTPGNGGSGGSGGSGGNGGNGGGGGGLPPDPCQDPVAQQCIQQWLDKAMGILNRRDTSNPAPGGAWHVSKYGNLLGHDVTADLTPEGWESVYHSNMYCRVWATWQQSHLNAGYGGELESLSDFVTKCYAAHGGGGGTGQPPPQQPGQPPTVSRMTLWADKRIAQNGDLVMLPISLLKGADVANMNFTASYDSSIVKPEGDPSKGYLLDDALFSANTGESGLVRLGFARTSGISGDGPVAYIPFRVTGKAGQRTPITLVVSTINNTGGSIPSIDLIHGQIAIAGPGGMISGDCDGDGVLTAADAWCALRMSVKLMPDKANMDMDGDGQITSRDATLILQKAVGR